jgi:hypothetical protein
MFGRIYPYSDHEPKGFKRFKRRQAAGIKKWTAWKKTIDPVEAPVIDVQDIEAKPEDSEKPNVEEQKVEEQKVE